MFKVERKEYYWEGSYWNPTEEGYTWDEMDDANFQDKEEACNFALQKANNPYTLGFRVVNADSGEVVEEFSYYKNYRQKEQK